MHVSSPTPDNDRVTQAPDGQPPAAETPCAPLTDFDAFLADARTRRATRAPRVAVSGDWCVPDPGAIADLPPHHRPVAQFQLRRGGRAKSRDGLRAQLDQVCRLVQDADGVPAEARRPADRYPWHHIDADHAARYRRLIHGRYANTGTRNLMLSLLREVLRECRRAQLISAARLDDLLTQLPTKRPGRTSRGRRLTQAELVALFRACQVDPEPRRATRDAAIIAVLAVTGIRASELASLDLAHWNDDDDSLFLEVTKNGRSHTVFLPEAALPYLHRWLDQRGTGSGALFTMVIGDLTRRISYAALCAMLKTRAAQAGVRPFASHDFRRTLASTLLRTHDMLLVSRILGHEDVASTAVYDLAGDEECRAAVESLPLPPAAEEDATAGDADASGTATGGES